MGFKTLTKWQTGGPPAGDVREYNGRQKEPAGLGKQQPRKKDIMGEFREKSLPIRTLVREEKT